MAQEKTKRWWPAILHGLTYVIPFIFVTQSIPALIVISVTHMVIDRYRLAKHLIWFKNQFAPKDFRPGHTFSGYSEKMPDWMATTLLIVTDNLIHIMINGAAILWL